jgi:hypothetical protein
MTTTCTKAASPFSVIGLQWRFEATVFIKRGIRWRLAENKCLQSIREDIRRARFRYHVNTSVREVPPWSLQSCINRVSYTVRVLFGLYVFGVIKSETSRMKVLPEPTSGASSSKQIILKTYPIYRLLNSLIRNKLQQFWNLINGQCYLQQSQRKTFTDYSFYKEIVVKETRVEECRWS